MAKGSVPITAASNVMVAKLVCRSVADGTVRLMVRNGETQPVEESDTELTVLKMEAKGTGGDNL